MTLDYTKEQLEVAETIVEASMGMRQETYILKAPGGFGKTATLGLTCHMLMRENHNIPITLTATTHAARVNLNKTLIKYNLQSGTIHSYLGAGRGGRRMSNLRFEAEDYKPPSRSTGLLVIDEYSMLTQEMYLAARKNHRGPILLVGDVMQLPPVGGAPVEEDSMKILTLTKNLRADNSAMANLSAYVREHGKLPDESEALCEISMGEFHKLPDDTILLSYKNADVDMLNDLIEQSGGRHRFHVLKNNIRLYDYHRYYNGTLLTDYEYNCPYDYELNRSVCESVAEETRGRVMPYMPMGPKKMYGYENFDFLRSGKLKGGKKPGKWRETTLVWTNKKPRFSMYLENYLTLAQCNEIRGQFWAFRGREARQEFLEEFEKVWMTIMARLGVHSRMSNQDVQERISELKDADTRKNINKLWNLLISADQSYADVRPASAFTIHSSQGQTFDYVALYVPEGSSISKRALYTAVSRARKRVFIITPNDSAAE